MQTDTGVVDTGSELESDTSSINDGITTSTVAASGGVTCHLQQKQEPLSRQQLEKRIESLCQENRVLKIEIDTYKLRVKSLQEENKELRKVSVNIQVGTHIFLKLFFYSGFGVFIATNAF